MSLRREPLFLARQNYRRRRVSDAARVVPLFGIVLFFLPLLSAGQGRNDTVGWLAYLFGAWCMLIIVTAILSRGVGRGPAAGRGDEGGTDTGPASRTRSS
ncbi:hypothetical protein [Aliiroseovarius crassostreae]|uniref:hypothetical protein n=1 Tax=Aliiroseovarius crassostreae TaxID=154981 RepID=UPI002206BCDF|nr:hypothetical protein [Aliiroseovarius crassostreae]UWP89894.1 hypothetical protein K3J57_04170 [Aliiroseovarius crassostreae]